MTGRTVYVVELRDRPNLDLFWFHLPPDPTTVDLVVAVDILAGELLAAGCTDRRRWFWTGGTDDMAARSTLMGTPPSAN